MSEDPIDLEAGTTELLAECFVASGGLEPDISIRTFAHEVMAGLVAFYEQNAASVGSSFDVSDPHTRDVVVESLVANAQLILAGMSLPPREELVELALSALGAN